MIVRCPDCASPKFKILSKIDVECEGEHAGQYFNEMTKARMQCTDCNRVWLETSRRIKKRRRADR